MEIARVALMSKHALHVATALSLFFGIAAIRSVLADHGRAGMGPGSPRQHVQRSSAGSFDP
jgi:hypothetical protein